MPRPDRVFKSAYNDTLDRLHPGVVFANKSALARELGVSRTTVRAILARLEEVGVTEPVETGIRVQRAPCQADYFEPSETLDVKEILETAFMRMVRDQEITPGTRLNDSYLARQFNAPVQTVREFLIGLSRFGIVRRDHHRRWVLEGITKQHALELHEVRTIFEERAIAKVCCIPDTDPFWGGLLRLRREHAAINASSDFDALDFSALDTRFHRFLNSKAENRLIVGLQDAIAMIFNYHYLWPMDNKADHNLLAARDHLDIIDCVLRRDKKGAKSAMNDHLSATRSNFIAAMCR